MAECAVVDLDGTILKGNSMREMIKFMLREGVKACDAVTVWKLLYWLCLRRTRLLTHRRMKFPIHRLASEFMLGRGRLERFLPILETLINSAVMDKIADLKNQGCKIIIATAAPDIYMPHFAKILNADFFTATPLTDTVEGYIENRGEHKLLRVKEIAENNGYRIRCVITDHKDDLPLLEIEGVERVLVSPDEILCDRLREQKHSFSVIR